MKKLLLTLGAMAMTSGAFAQGYVTFGNGTQTQVDTNLSTSPFFGGTGGGQAGFASASDPKGTLNGASANYYVALLTESYSGSLTSDTNVFDGTWSFTGLQTQNAPSGQPGKVVQITDQQTVNWNVGTTQQFILAAWSANLGSTWGTVSNELATGTFASVLAGANGFFGVSAVSFAAAQPAPSAPAAILWSSNQGAQSYGTPITTGIATYLLPVPEPTTLALAGLGGLALALFRRQRK